MDQFNTLIVRSGAELPLRFVQGAQRYFKFEELPSIDRIEGRETTDCRVYLYLAPIRSPSSRTRPVVMPRRPRARPPGAGTTCGPSGARRAGPRTR